MKHQEREADRKKQFVIMQNKKKVSIIVPVYNVEHYLEECLCSIVNQTFENIEIILINDGSTDRSFEIMKDFAKKDSRIKIISQQNKGVSEARNSGIRVASGEYILFVDSDDIILTNTVETLYNKIIQTNSELLIGDVLYYYPDGSKVSVSKRNEMLNTLTCISSEDFFTKHLEEYNFSLLVYLFFCKRELIVEKKIFFKKGIIHEDDLWCVQVLLNANRISIIDFNYYTYRQREGSLMHSDNKEFRMKSISVVIKEFNKIAVKLKKEGRQQETIRFIYIRIFAILFHIHYLQQELNYPAFTGYEYISKLLKNIYSELLYSQQRSCLMSYYFSNPDICKKLQINRESQNFGFEQLFNVTNLSHS
jgi:glycosyltransferase involved in cell wall biosynthesis